MEIRRPTGRLYNLYGEGLAGHENPVIFFVAEVAPTPPFVVDKVGALPNDGKKKFARVVKPGRMNNSIKLMRA